MSMNKQIPGAQITFIIGKQRNGPVGDVKLTFLKEFGKFSDPAPFTEEGVFSPEEF